MHYIYMLIHHVHMPSCDAIEWRTTPLSDDFNVTNTKLLATLSVFVKQTIFLKVQVTTVCRSAIISTTRLWKRTCV